jgi:cytochrome c biogenesis protein ResB
MNVLDPLIQLLAHYEPLWLLTLSVWILLAVLDRNYQEKKQLLKELTDAKTELERQKLEFVKKLEQKDKEKLVDSHFEWAFRVLKDGKARLVCAKHGEELEILTDGTVFCRSPKHSHALLSPEEVNEHG